MRSRLMGQHLSDAPCDIATLTFDLGGHGACCRSSYSIYIPSLKFVGLSVGIYDALPISALVDLVTLTFDLETGARYCRWGGQHLLAILVFLERFVLDLWANTCQEDDVTLVLWDVCQCSVWCDLLMQNSALAVHAITSSSILCRVTDMQLIFARHLHSWCWLPIDSVGAM